MLNEKDIIGKLYDQAEIFKHHMRRKEYLEAALCVDTASMVAHKLEVPEDIRRANRLMFATAGLSLLLFDLLPLALLLL